MTALLHAPGPAPEAGLVVFDFGGVVFRWQPLTLMRQVLPQHCSTEDDARSTYLAIAQGFAPNSDWAEFDLGHVSAAELAQRIARRTSLPQADVLRFIDAVPAHLQPVPDTVALMLELRNAGHRLCFLSNMPEPFARELERSNPFLREFDTGLYSARVGLIKPQAEMFALAQQRFGGDPRRTMFLDDVMHNVEAARAHGWQAVQFTAAAQCRAALAAQGWLASPGSG